jgi:hypothetical protein
MTTSNVDSSVGLKSIQQFDSESEIPIWIRFQNKKYIYFQVLKQINIV